MQSGLHSSPHVKCSLPCVELIPGLHTGFFYGGGTHISAASRGSGGMLPKKIFCILRWTMGGGTHISAASRGSGGMLPKKIFCILRWTLT